MFIDNTDSSIKSSIGAGGRYDKIIGQFIGTDDEYPAVGMTFGVDVIMEAIRELKAETADTNVEYLIIPMNGFELDALTLANKLREVKVKVDVDLTGRKIKKSMNSANILNIPFVSIYGAEEKDSETIKIKNMQIGEEISFYQVNIQQIRYFIYKARYF